MPSVLAQLRFLGTSQREFIDFLRSHEVEYADAAGRLPIADGVVEVVYSSHMLEHLDQNEASTFLTETMRVLQPGGIVRLALPDIKKQVEAYLSGGNADTFIAGTHLTQPRARSLASRLRLLVTGTRHHHWMYDGSSLCQLLASRGFARPIVVAPGETRIPNPGELDLFERSSESVYVEAEKA